MNSSNAMNKKYFRYVSILITVMMLVILGTHQPDAADTWREIMKKPDGLQGYYYATPYAFSNGHYGIMRVWNQGYAQRVELDNFGTGDMTILLTRQQDGAYYQIDPQRNEAIGFRYREEEIPPGVLDESRYAVSGDRYDPVFLSRIQNVEQLEYLQQEALYFEVRSPHRNGEETYRAWISVEYGLPLKEEMVMADGRIHQRVYTDLQEGPFPPDLFLLPEDVEILSWTWFN
ncbi:hypothetical protein [Anoxynatronum sibiricum]|uniref:DUF4412 domain-containing protein n=1 Tax=Anoxynatronum sibiricum TaxID=210623 RepID=A0ABU9VSE9_9CLOT